MNYDRFVKFLAVGQIHNEFIIDLNGRVANNLVGGPVVYTAASISHWGGTVGLISGVGSDFPETWKDELMTKGIDTRGVRTLPQELDLRAFFAYVSPMKTITDNPVAVFSAKGLPLPKELIGFSNSEIESALPKLQTYSKTLMTNLPPEYLDALAAHLSPLDITCQIQLSSLLLKGSVRTISIQPHPSFMNPTYWDDFSVLVKDATVMITREADLKSLFHGRSTNIWEMMECVAGFGCAFVIIDDFPRGFYFYDATNSSRYRVPRYPGKVIDPTGEIDSFCGGFLVGFQSHYDPLRSVVQGSAAASITVENTGPFAINDCLPGLDQMRMDVIQNMITRV